MTIIAYVSFCVLINAYSTRAILDLEQHGCLYACHEGAMSVRCSTSADLLQWNITLLHNGSLHNQRTFIRDLSYIGTANMATPILTAMTTLNVSRSLNNSSSLPLISTISTDNTETDLNGAVITCSGISPSSKKVLEINIVEVILIGNSTGSANITPILNFSDQFGPNSILVTLVWSHKNGVSYNVSVNPQTMDVINYTGKNSAQLMLLYDTKYNVSVVASLCGHNSTTLRVINYVTCNQLASESDKSVSHRNPAVVGTVAFISCPPGMVLTGPNVTTCMANRYWEPDPESIICKVNCHTPVVNSNVSLNYSSTLEDAFLTFKCKGGLLPDGVFTSRCYRNETWIPNPSSHVCATSSAANCGEPSPPSDGYLEPYTSTSEGARVNRVHVCQNRQQSIEETIHCSPDGQWEVINGSACISISSNRPSSSMNYLIITGVSLGCFFGVTMLIIIVVIMSAVIVIKRKGSSRRNLPKPVSLAHQERRDHEYQDEYSVLGHSVNQRVEPSYSHIPYQNEYSLLQYVPDPEVDRQTNSNDVRCQPTTTTTTANTTSLVYADITPFNTQHVLSVGLDHSATRVEYMQLKGHGTDELPTQPLTTSPADTKLYAIDYKINLDCLLIQLKPTVTDKWYQFGKAIGINKELLDKCAQFSPEQSLIEILDNWLRNHNGQPTWNEIASALDEIGLEQLALDIKRIYETGKLPIEVDRVALDSHMGTLSI